jgi:hypothetical protein
LGDSAVVGGRWFHHEEKKKQQPNDVVRMELKSLQAIWMMPKTNLKVMSM